MGKTTAMEKKANGAGNVEENMSVDSQKNGAQESCGVSDDEPGNAMKNKLARKMTGGASMKTTGRSKKIDERGTDKNSFGTRSESVEKLQRENNRLRKQVEDIEAGGRNICSKLLQKNQALEKEIGELKKSLSREPAYSDVVRELKMAKMALALVNLEKEELHFEFQKYKRGEIRPASSTLSTDGKRKTKSGFKMMAQKFRAFCV